MHLAVGVISFTAPWALGALLLLPVIWWLVRVSPPTPSAIVFPAVRFLFGLGDDKAAPDKAPWWLLLFRCLIAALVILAVAGPVISGSLRLGGSGPLVLIVDDTWAAASRWDRVKGAMTDLIGAAGREGRPIFLAFTAPVWTVTDGLKVEISEPMSLREALRRVETSTPKPWPADRAKLAQVMQEPKTIATIGSNASVIWLSDGMQLGDSGVTESFVDVLREFGEVRVYSDDPSKRASLLLKPIFSDGDLVARVLRASNKNTKSTWVRAFGEKRRLLDRVQINFEADDRIGEGIFRLPEAVRNEIFSIEIEGESSAGAVLLIDERWKRRTIGIVSGGDFESQQPLLSDLYYIERALNPYNEIRLGDMETLVDSDLSVLILTDTGKLSEEWLSTLRIWMDEGGILIRFAGPRLASAKEALVPVPLRGDFGGRAMGGAMSWEQPMGLGPMSEDSPFSHLESSDEVVVNRQVLAEPSPEVMSRTWARLSDGTPLVTGLKQGEGWLILFHVTSNAEWSNLPLSGVFVDMLRSIVKLGKGTVVRNSADLLPPLVLVDGFGNLRDTKLDSGPITVKGGVPIVQGPDPIHPPGMYGSASYRYALNLGDYFDDYDAISSVPSDVQRIPLDSVGQIHLSHWLLCLAISFFLIDCFLSWYLRGLMKPLKFRGLGQGIFLCLLIPGIIVFPQSPVVSQEFDFLEPALGPIYAQTDEFIVESTREIRLAYVVTGDPEVDAISRAGLIGLSWILRQRTAIEPSVPVGVSLEESSILLYPLVYWPITGNGKSFTDKALANIDGYLKVGGMVLLDTRDHARISVSSSEKGQSKSLLRQILVALNPPPMLPVPEGHALRQAFYLINDFPGRWEGGEVWVERYEGGVNDGVSSLIIGENDWGAAWALSPGGNPLFPLVPGGEPQRERSFKFGVNLVMYALTGNYKGDQVHIPSILGRLQRNAATAQD